MKRPRMKAGTGMKRPRVKSTTSRMASTPTVEAAAAAPSTAATMAASVLCVS